MKNDILKKDIITYLTEFSEIIEKKGDRVSKKNFDKATKYYFKVGAIKAIINELKRE